MRWFLILFTLMLSASAMAQSPTTAPTTVPAVTAADEKLKAGARQQAQTAMDALMADKFDVFVAALDPAIIQQMGGREKMIAMLGDGKAKMKKNGMALDGATAGPVRQMETSGGKLFAIVPEQLQLSFPKATATQISYLLAVSVNNGEKWTFVDGASGEKELRKMFPEISSSFEFPKPQAPTGVKTK